MTYPNYFSLTPGISGISSVSGNPVGMMVQVESYHFHFLEQWSANFFDHPLLSVILCLFFSINPPQRMHIYSEIIYMHYWIYVFFLHSVDCLAHSALWRHFTSESTVQEKAGKYYQSRQVIFTILWVPYVCELLRILYNFGNFQDASGSYCF